MDYLQKTKDLRVRDIFVYENEEWQVIWYYQSARNTEYNALIAFNLTNVEMYPTEQLEFDISVYIIYLDDLAIDMEKRDKQNKEDYLIDDIISSQQ